MMILNQCVWNTENVEYMWQFNAGIKGERKETEESFKQWKTAIGFESERSRFKICKK